MTGYGFRNAKGNPDPDLVDPKHGTECGFETYVLLFSSGINCRIREQLKRINSTNYT